MARFNKGEFKENTAQRDLIIQKQGEFSRNNVDYVFLNVELDTREKNFTRGMDTNSRIVPNLYNQIDYAKSEKGFFQKGVVYTKDQYNAMIEASNGKHDIRKDHKGTDVEVTLLKADVIVGGNKQSYTDRNGERKSVHPLVINTSGEMGESSQTFTKNILEAQFNRTAKLNDQLAASREAEAPQAVVEKEAEAEVTVDEPEL